MKPFKTLLSATLLSAPLVLSAQAHAGNFEFVANDNSQSTQVCMAVASNKPLTLHIKLKEKSLSRALVAKKLQCNNMPVGDFAATYGLNRTARALGVTGHTKIRDIAKTSAPIKIQGS